MNYFKPNKLLNYDDDSIINEIKRVYFKVFQGKRMTTKKFSQHSRVSVDTIIKRFGSWHHALQKAGIITKNIKVEKKKQIPLDEIKRNIDRVITLNKGEYFTYKFYKENNGKHSFATLTKRFGYTKWDELLNKEFSIFRIRKIILQKQKPEPIPEWKLFNEIKTVWDNICRRPTYSEFKENAKIGIRVYERRFGTWTKAIERFCLANEEYNSSTEDIGFNTTKDLLIQELHQIVRDNNLEILNQGDYKKYGGKYSVQTYYNHFGSWKNAKKAAGLKIGRVAPSEEELFNELQRIWEQLGRQPLHNEMKKLGKYSHKSYAHKFGSWIQAIYAFIADREGENQTNDKEKVIKDENLPKEDSNKTITHLSGVIKMTTPRIPSTRLRFQVLHRDKFTCVTCGRSPKNTKNITLHVDHITPYSKGGETVYDNLQTLCSKCNLGKSDTEL